MGLVFALVTLRLHDSGFFREQYTISDEKRMFGSDMKAVIMAGGEGTRLRPLSLGRPKPMTPLFDKPVMEHIIDLLRRHQITEIAVTLQYMPRVVTDYFGDGAQFGVHLHYFVEQAPLGTAGSVKNCMSFLGDDDFLVISGDAVCDLDLSECIAFHKTRHSLATLVLYAHPTPLEYGLVLTQEDGRISRFIEKPGWGQVMTNTVNTGIYLLTSKAMEQVPEGNTYDFGKDLFPTLLEERHALYGYSPAGYWCDMGDSDAYLQCVADTLSGKVSLEIGAPRLSPGVWSAIPIPDGVTVIPPCYLGPDTVIGEEVVIGPHVALGRGGSIGAQTMVQRSALHGAVVGDNATLYGAIVCKGARIGRGAVLNEGTVLGEDCSVGEQAIVMERVKIWPNRVIPPQTRQCVSLTAGSLRGPVKFADGGVIRGILGEELTPELMVLLGNILGSDARAGLGYGGGEGARMLAHAAGCGMSAAGCRVFESDAACPSACAWITERELLPVSLFAEQEGEHIYLHLFDKRGLPLSRASQRKIEGALLRGEQSRVPARRVGARECIVGGTEAYTLDAARRAGGGHVDRPVTVSIPGSQAADHAMAKALTAIGCRVLRGGKENVPTFHATHGGFYLAARDENGQEIKGDTLLAILALIAFESETRCIAVPPAAPAALEKLAEAHHATVLRLTRDGAAAEACYQALPCLRDAVFAACRICAWMSVRGKALHELVSQIPRFHTVEREVSLRGDRGQVMQALSRTEQGITEMGEGFRVHTRGGWVYIAPLTRRAALRVIAEGMDTEVAAELCSFYTEKARRLDRGGGQVVK